MKNQIIRITIATLLIGTVMLFGQGKLASIFRPNYVSAIGDLTVNFGVAPGTPLFNITNMKPGDVVSKTIIVTNDALSDRPVAIQGIKTNGLGNLEQVLDIVISKGGIDVYGGTTGAKTLSNFFADSAGPNGIPLSTLSPNQTADYVITVTFKQTAGNEFQSTNVVFDIKIGIYIDIPAECSSIALLQTPIFGTNKSDIIKGTNGNDLIVAFEGNDIVNAGGGNDCILASEGNDIINGANGADVIDAGSGNDILNGQGGNDILMGQDGRDILNGEGGSDIANGGTLVDICHAENETNCEL